MNKDNYILSNIISNGSYYLTIKELFDINKTYYTNIIKKKDGTKIENKINPDWLENINNKEELYELSNTNKLNLKEIKEKLQNIENLRLEENTLYEEQLRLRKIDNLISEKLNLMED